MNIQDFKNLLEEVFAKQYTLHTMPEGTVIRFHESRGSDYRFEGWIDSGLAFLEVRAVLNSEWQRAFPGHDYFWRNLYETVSSDTPDHVVREFLETSRLLVTHDTRICQRKGFLSWMFKCEYLQDGKWIQISSNSTFRWSRFHPPKIKNECQWYQAKAIVQ